MSIAYMIVMLQRAPSNPTLHHLAGCGASGLATWLLIYGVTVFVRYFESPRPLQRYLSDASCWMYLIHLPLVIWIAGLLAPLALPAAVKVAIVLSATIAVTVTTYHFLVRSTAIGAFLNGRRFERAWPRMDIGAGRRPDRAVRLDVTPTRRRSSESPRPPSRRYRTPWTAW